MSFYVQVSDNVNENETVYAVNGNPVKKYVFIAKFG